MTSNGNDEGLVGYFTADHGDCDEEWARVEALLDGSDAAALKKAWETFDQHLRRHLSLEEEILFPAFEAASGMGMSGPTVVMRMEHDQMRGLLDQIGFNIETGDTDEALDLGDTLHLLTQQHNMKEEGMLYPMAGEVLGGQWNELRDKLARF